MSFYAVNCGYDPVYFELALGGILKSDALCVLLAAQPLGYLRSKQIQSVFGAYYCIQSEFYLLFVRHPHVFTPLDSDTLSVCMGVVLFNDKRIGIIAYSHYDVLLETTDVLDFILPNVIAAFTRLLKGGSDSKGQDICPCDTVIVMGSFFCRGFPVGELFPWPNLVYNNTTHKLNSYYHTHVQTLACIYQPYFFDLRDESLYLDASKCTQENVEDVVENALEQSHAGLQRGVIAEYDIHLCQDKRVTDDELLSTLCTVFKSSTYTSSRNLFYSSEPELNHPCPEDFIFSSTWVQYFSPQVSGVITDRCIHFATGSRESTPTAVSNGNQHTGFIDDDFNKSLYEPMKITRFQAEVLPDLSAVLNDHSFSDTVRALAKLFASPDVKPRPDLFLIYKMPLSDNLVRMIQSCQVYLYEARSCHFKDKCIFGQLHLERKRLFKP